VAAALQLTPLSPLRRRCSATSSRQPLVFEDATPDGELAAPARHPRMAKLLERSGAMTAGSLQAAQRPAPARAQLRSTTSAEPCGDGCSNLARACGLPAA